MHVMLCPVMHLSHLFYNVLSEDVVVKHWWLPPMWPGSNLGNAIRGPFKSVVASLYCSGLEYPGFFSPQKPKTHTLCAFQFDVRITLIQQHITQRP